MPIARARCADKPPTLNSPQQTAHFARGFLVQFLAAAKPHALYVHLLAHAHEPMDGDIAADRAEGCDAADLEAVGLFAEVDEQARKGYWVQEGADLIPSELHTRATRASSKHAVFCHSLRAPKQEGGVDP